MARSTRPVVHYIATRPDGTLPPTDVYLAQAYRSRGETIPTVNLADHIGENLDHPCPGRPWYTEKPFDYFHMYTRPGEILERIEDGWPVRLFIVEPLGETGTWGPGYTHWVLSHQIHVVEETDAWKAFGHRGAQTLAVLAQLPDFARQWAEEWAADPEGTRRKYKAWEQRVDHTRALTGWAFCRAQYSRREAALQAANQLAGEAAGQAATAAGADPHTVALIQLRARCLAAGQLMFDRIRTGEYEKEIRTLLLGSALDTPITVPA
jgi:hypothetical protein